MCYFDSPVGRCAVVREMVLLDETQQECAREHGCDSNRACPLQRYFTEQSGIGECGAALDALGKRVEH